MKKSIRILSTIFSFTILFSCGDNASATIKVNTANNQKESSHTFEVDQHQIISDFDSLEFIKKETINSPIGEIKNVWVLGRKETDSVQIRLTFYENLPNIKLEDLFLSIVYSEYNEETTPSLQYINDSSLVAHFCDTISWSFQKRENLTLFIKDNKSLSRIFKISSNKKG